MLVQTKQAEKIINKGDGIIFKYNVNIDKLKSARTYDAYGTTFLELIFSAKDEYDRYYDFKIPKINLSLCEIRNEGFGISKTTGEKISKYLTTEIVFELLPNDKNKTYEISPIRDNLK